MSFEAILAALWRFHGYEVSTDARLEGRSGTVYTVPLLAEKGGHAVLVDVQLDGAESLADLDKVRQDIAADVTVLCHLGDADGQPPDGVILWGPRKLATLLGEQLLAESTGMAARVLPLPFEAEGDGTRAPDEAVLPEAFEVSEKAPSEALSLAIEEGLEEQRAWAGDGVDLASFEDMEPEETGPGGLPWIGEKEQDGDEGPDAEALLAEIPDDATASGDPLDVEPDSIAGDGGNEWEAIDDLLAQAATEGPDADVGTADEQVPPSDGPMVMPEADLPEAEVETGSDGLALAEPASETSSDAPAVPSPVTPPLLPLNLDADRAKAAAVHRMAEVLRHELVLRPVHLFRYSCEVLAEGSLDFATETGWLEVDAQNRHVRAIDAALAKAPAPEMPPVALDVRTVRIPSVRAAGYARDEVLRRHTRTVEVQVEEDEGSFSYTEKRQVRPRPDSVQVDDEGLRMRPVWRFWGPEGHVDIDAVSGEPVGGVEKPDGDVMFLD